MSSDIKTLRVPAQLRKHVIRTVKPKTAGERELLDAAREGAAKLESQGKNALNTIELDLTNAALGVAIKLARGWLDSDNGNNIMAAKSLLKFELEYEPDDPREIRHEVKLPKSVAELFPNVHGMEFKNNKRVPKAVKAAMRQMSWGTAGASGRITNETLEWFLKEMRRQYDHPTPSVQRAVRKCVNKYNPLYEQTERLINGYTGGGEVEEDQAAEPVKANDDILTADGFLEAIHGRGPETQRAPLVIIACGGKKSNRRGKIPAHERYTGNYFTACLMAAEVMEGPTMILSAAYGLIPLDEEIEDYDMRLGDKGSVRLATVKQQAEELGLLDAKVTVLGGERYVKGVRQVWPDAEAPLKGGIGQQLAQLAEMSGGEVLEDDEVTSRPWEKRRVMDFVNWGNERRFFYYGGPAKQPVNENGPLVGLKWSESSGGTNFLKIPETGEVVASVHSQSSVWAIPADAPEDFVEYEDRGKTAEELYWPEKYIKGEFRNVPNLPSRGRTQEPVIWYGGKGGRNILKPKNGWQKVKVVYTGEGRYALYDLKTNEEVHTCRLTSQIFWATVNEEPAPVDEAPAPVEVEDQEPEEPTSQAGNYSGNYEVPENFLELAEEGNTEAARRYWTRRCEEYRRTGK
ncbi:DUF6884 domain-containing protein [Streptomyces sp. NPDC046853]|uniref:DUF6884 domain-containing protein n=1 Tax=Streptomyces sp. NPDC046853 TaxID=3154920 RepID=UPI0034105D76